MSLRKLFGRFYFGLSLLILITLRASAEVINQTSPKDDLVNSSRLGFWISFFGLIGTILALILAAYIAKRQGTQITNLGKVQDQTFDITQKMQTKKVTQGNVNDFFKLEGDIKKNYYAVYFPIEYNKKPLPLINEGDYYAIHLIGNLLGDENLILHAISKDEQIDIEPNKIMENMILICAPHSNPALNCIFPIRKISNEDELNKIRTENWPLNNKEINLPCWFVEETEEVEVPHFNSNEQETVQEREMIEWTSRKIWVSETNDLISSPTEVLYQAAYLSPGKFFIHPEKNQQDFGIFARLTIENKHIIIIAGIHQYGTWIIGGLLNNILTGLIKELELKKLYFGKNDFIAIIWGEFNYKKLKVERTKILTDYAWIKEGDTWTRIKP